VRRRPKAIVCSPGQMPLGLELVQTHRVGRFSCGSLPPSFAQPSHPPHRSDHPFCFYEGPPRKTEGRPAKCRPLQDTGKEEECGRTSLTRPKPAREGRGGHSGTEVVPGLSTFALLLRSLTIRPTGQGGSSKGEQEHTLRFPSHRTSVTITRALSLQVPPRLSTQTVLWSGPLSRP
jgi:hypothetical protein